jgi:hypothetical protein
MDVLSPQPLTAVIRNSDRDESFIAISSARQNDADFLAVMVPEGKPANGDYAVRPKPSRIDSNGWIGAVLNDSNTKYYGLFRINQSSATGIEGFKTDASRLTAVISKDQLKEVYFEGKDFEAYGSGLRFTKPVIVSFSLLSSSANFEIKSETPCELIMASLQKPSSVIQNGQFIKNWKYDQNSKNLTLLIPQGQSKIVVNY